MDMVLLYTAAMNYRQFIASRRRRDEEIIRLRGLKLPWGVERIAKKFGISKQRVSQIMKARRGK